MPGLDRALDRQEMDRDARPRVLRDRELAPALVELDVPAVNDVVHGSDGLSPDLQPEQIERAALALQQLLHHRAVEPPEALAAEDAGAVPALGVELREDAKPLVELRLVA